MHGKSDAFGLAVWFGLQAVTSGANPINIKRGIDKTCSFLVGKLKENAKPVQGSDDIKARCSSALLN